MKSFKLALVSVAVVTALGVTACGDKTVTPATTATPPKTTSGVITGFGSVFINGVEYDTASASVSVKGATSAESNLKVGMVVKLAGSVDANGTTGIASSISFADETEGFVTGLYDATAGTIKVMGQTVHITTDTILDSDVSGKAAPTAASLVVGDTVEVSGFSSASGEIFATRIALKPAKSATEEIELKGVVSALDTTAKTFMLGALKVSYDNTTSLNVGSGGLVDGLYVEVKFLSQGALASLTATTPSLLASKIEVEDDGKKGEQGDEGKEGELQGTVTGAFANNTFSVNGQTISVTAETKYEDGKTNSTTDIVVGGKVEIEGIYDANGELVAEKVHFGHDEAEILESEGAMTSYDATSKTLVFTPTGQSPITVKVNNMTIVKDDSAAADRYFNASKLASGDMIEVKYDQSTMIATRLERK